MTEMEKWTDLEGLRGTLPGKWSKRYIYYLVQTKQIPHYKPSPNKLLFNLEDVEAWLLASRVEPEVDEAS